MYTEKDIKVKRLRSGWYHISGPGVCNWTQPPRCPGTMKEFRDHAFPEASEEFLCAAHRILNGEDE